MALQVFAFNSIGPGVRAQLNTTDDLIIDAGVTVSRTDGNNFTQHTVQGTGSNHSLEIDGRVLGSGGVIDIGDQLATDQNNDIEIGANAIVRSSDNYAIRMRSFDSFLKNEGTLQGDSFGVIIGGSNNGTQSLIRNSGSILGKNDDGISRFGGSTEQLKIINTGTIKGFKQGEDDKIDLVDIDAQASTAGDQAFDFIGKNAFSGNEGELRYVKSGGQTLVQADTDGDFQADFTVALNKVVNFDSSDFLL